MAEDAYRGRVVVVTGASSGFGRDTALELAKRGAFVALAARSADTLAEIARDCVAAGGQAEAFAIDVSDVAQVERLAVETIARFGRFDVWINNAGVATIARFDQAPLRDHVQVIETDLIGTIAGSYVALRHFRERGDGTLINVASVLGKIPAPYFASYAAAKYGVVGLSDALRQELRNDKSPIRVCTIMPMSHSTEFFEHAGNYTGHESVPIPPTYDPKVTVDALVKLVVEPEDEVIAGWQGSVFDIFHRLMPGAIERTMAARTKSALEEAPTRPPTAGNVHAPSGE